MATNKLQQRIETVRDALDEAGAGLSPAEWKELLEEIGAHVDCHLEAIREESELKEGETL